MDEDGGLPGDDLTSEGGRAPVTGGWKEGFTLRGPSPPLAAWQRENSSVREGK